MSASMLRQMLTDAAAFLKAERFQEAQDASRRVTQFDPSNFQAFMCVGLASFQLQEWEDCEEAYRRAADIKPELPAPWKNLVDLYDAQKDLKSKLEPLEKLVAILQRFPDYCKPALPLNNTNKKVKPSQKWMAEVATTAMELKLLPKAFDAWYSLVGEQEGDLSLEKTPNDELPAPLSIWLDLVDLLQRPGFSLADCTGTHSMTAISSQFFSVASQWDWAAEDEKSTGFRPRMDGAIAFFMRLHLDELKATTAEKKKSMLLKAVDALALSLVGWFPSAKIPTEFLLLRCEDQNSPIDTEKTHEIAGALIAAHPKSPMAQVFQAVECLRLKEDRQAHEHLVEALASCASSSFHEGVLCIRIQVELASLALTAHDVEGCLNRLALAKKVVADKTQALGCASPLSTIYSEAKAQFMGAKARELSGEFDKALNAYRTVTKSGDSSLGVQAALAIAELLSARKQPQDALKALDAFPVSGVEDEVMAAVLSCTRGWLLYGQGDLEDAQALLEANVSKIPTTDATAKGRSLKRLAIVYWHLGGSYQQDKTRCFNHLLQAAKLTPSDAQIFAWLGKWYQDVVKDILRAEKCFLKALSLSSIDELAGMALSDLYIQQGKHELNVKLWERVTEDQETAPTWALLLLAQHLVDQNDELAVGKMHLVLRNEPLNARYWVILAHIYRNFDKQVSAQKSYLKAIELGEESWCVRCELARIEGSLRLFDDALERIEPMVLGDLPASSSVSEDSPDVTVASMLYVNLLFQQAKYLCADGLYGHAAANLKQSSRIMKGLPSASMLSGSVEACKLIGDIHCFAFYLSPEDFSSSEGATWVDFIGEGRKAYEAAVLLTGKMSKTAIHDAGSAAATADMYYDIGLSYWYEAQAVASVRGLQLPAFSPQSGPIDSEDDAILFKLKTKAEANFRLALQADPACAAAWNGLALVADKLLVKQFCWARAVQTGSSSDATWANLGMFYLDQADAVSAATSLAQKSFLQLQSMNADNPSMWNGYAMLARRQAVTSTDSNSIKQQKKAIEAFDCALQVGLDLDALLGLSMALLDYEGSVGKAVTHAAEHRSEQVMFYLKKYLERDPFNARAWHALGVTQHRLGLHAEALASYARAASSLQATASELGQRGLEWNTLVAEVGALSSTPRNADSKDPALLQILAKLMNAMKDASSVLYNVVQAQLLYRQSKGDAALDLLKKLLLREDLQPNESEDVAMVGLSIASLLMDECTSKATDIAVVCKDRLLSSTTLAESASASSDNTLILRLIELHERLVSAGDACLSRLQIAVQTSDDSSSSTAWTRLALATIDSESLQVSSCLVDYLRSGAQARDATPSGDDAADRSFLDALVGLFKAGFSGTTPRLPVDALKLIRMQPWNPHAYVLAGASVLKRISLEASDESHVQLFRQLACLLQTGLSFADAKNGDEYNAAQLELLMGYCYVKLGEQEQAEACAERGFTWVRMGKESGALVSSVDAELLESRLLSISSPAKAIARYLSIIATVSDAASPSAGRLVPILNELGGLYEEQELLNAAIQVWKLVASLTSSKTIGSFELDDDSSSTTTALSSSSDTGACFLANLRLSLIHGKKHNLKTARKHMKAALALVEGDSDSSTATVAAFVDNVLANAS